MYWLYTFNIYIPCFGVVYIFSVPAVHTRGLCVPSSCTRTSVDQRKSVILTLTNTRDPPYACRDEEVTFNCDVINGISLQWVSKPVIPCNVPISYAIGDVEGDMRARGSTYQSHLISVARNRLNSNFSSNLTFTANGSANSVTVVCGDRLRLCRSTEVKRTLNITGKCMLFNFKLSLLNVEKKVKYDFFICRGTGAHCPQSFI